MINKLEIIKKGIIMDDNIYHVIPFEGYKTHFLGINNDNHIALLLKTENTSNISFVNFKGKNLTTTIARTTATKTAAKICNINSIWYFYFYSITANLQFFFIDKNFYSQFNVSLIF